ncbi:VWFA-related domain-containing protein [Fibrobacter sp. UWH5]|nr:VWFA-related domain-containing protein [Fibrobacter sp. UWH5]
MSLKNFFGRVLGVCIISLAASAVFTAGAFAAGSTYKISATATEYNVKNNGFLGSTNYSNEGVRLIFVAPTTGTYTINFQTDAPDKEFKIIKTDSSYNANFLTTYFYSTFKDSVAVNAGDSLFYKVNNYWYADTLENFKVSYSTLTATTKNLTVTSASKNCYTSGSSGKVVVGTKQTFFGYGKEGYRPAGWKYTSDSLRAYDNITYKFSAYFYGNTKLELQCEPGKIYDITTKRTGYDTDRDFYDVKPENGIWFRYVFPDTNLHVIKGSPKSRTHYFYSYENDSTFTTSKGNRSLYRYSFVPVKGKKGDSWYFKDKQSYYDYKDSLFIQAMDAAIVTTQGKTRPDTVGINDTLSVSVSVKADSQLVNWYVISGKGTFADSSLKSTLFIPSTAQATIGYKLKLGEMYTLTSKPTSYSTPKNGSATKDGYYGIRFKFVATDSSNYTISYNTQNTIHILSYQDDSLFSRSKSSTYNYNGNGHAFTAEKGKTYYFLLDQYSDPAETINVSVQKALKVDADIDSTQGYIYISGNQKNYDYSHIKGDSLSLSAYSRNDYIFSKWEVTSGQCSVLDPKKASTKLVINSDCRIKAVYRLGQVYPIIATPVSYDFNDHSFSNASYNKEVRLKFVAPKAGKYTIAISRPVVDYSERALQITRYKSSAFSTADTLFSYVSSILIDTLNMNAGDSIFYSVKSYYSNYQDDPFWISYSQNTASLTIITDSLGTASPSGYSSAYTNVAYPIRISSSKHNRFDHWRVIKGKAIIKDSLSNGTVVIIRDSSTIKAVFKKGVFKTLSTVKKHYDFYKDFYSESLRTSVLFKWTPTDTLKHMLGITFDSTTSYTINHWGTDSTLSNSTRSWVAVGNTFQAQVSGTPGVPLYFEVKLSSAYGFKNPGFTISEQTPVTVIVSESSNGRVFPKNEIITYPGFDTSLTAIPYGGYKFKSWELVTGTATFASKDSATTRIKPTSRQCTIRPNFELDSSTVTAVSILDINLNEHPGVCVSVSASDSKTGNPIQNLSAENFEIFQDGKSVPTQVSTMEQVGGVSVALVVDESGSMSGTRITEAKESIRQFISDMGQYDRTAIVGFSGGSNYKVHQTMTSDKELLMNAVDRLTASGGTNIKTGAYYGVEQVFGETNPTAVIIFSDGDNGSETISSDEVIDYAKSLNTTIYSVGIGGNYEVPLKELAEATGGTYTNAPTAGQLASIYSEVRTSVQTRYVVCYRSPDMILDGDVHTVSVNVKFLENASQKTATWSEDFTPPIIRLTDSTKALIGKKQAAGDSIVIEARITTKSDVDYARIYLRHAGIPQGSFSPYDMENVSGNLWRFVVSDSMAVAPGIDFYIIAADTTGLMGRGPNVSNPAAQPYTIPIDNQAPSVSMVYNCADTSNGKATFSFNILDNDGIYEARLFYKNSDMVVFNGKALSHLAGENRWSVKIPSSLFQGDSVEFYLRATDKAGVTTRWKTFRNSFINACEEPIEEEEDIPEEDSTRVADKAEIYDLNLDGTADFIKIRFQEKLLKKIAGIDTLFWNSPDGDWRSVTQNNVEISSDSLWITANLEPFKYGLTSAKNSPYLRILHKKRGKTQKLKIRDKIGAVVVSAQKRPGEFAINNDMGGINEIYPDTLIVKLSEPIEVKETTSSKKSKKSEDREPWQKLFRYSENCEDTVSHPINLLSIPKKDSSGLVWTLLLKDRVVNVGNCIITDHQAPYQDEAGNAMGRGGVEATGTDIATYLYKIRSNPSVSGLGQPVEWIPDGQDEWETQPDSISSVEVWTIAPYKVSVTIYDGMAQVLATFNQEFGSNGEMEMESRSSSEHRYKVGFISWNQRSSEGRLAGTGVYTWRILFRFEDGHSELRVLNTGIKRKQK